MKWDIRNLSQKIQRKFIFYFGITFFLFIATLFLIENQVGNEQEKNSQKQILASASAFNTIFGERFSIVASSDIFKEYLRAGESTRAHILPDFLLEIALLKSPLFPGMILASDNGKIIFRSGNETNFPISLKICYLNGSLDPTLGECKYLWIIFLDKKEYVKEFLSFNPDISYCENCSSLNLFDSKVFGAFGIGNETLLAKLAVKNTFNADILRYFSIISIILLICYFLMKYHIGRIFNDFIATPVSNLTKKIKSDTLQGTDQYPLEELQYMSDQLFLWYSRHKEVERTRREAALGKQAAKVAHDIRSPLVALNSMLEHLSDLDENLKIMARDAINRINDISNNLLCEYRSNENDLGSLKNKIALSPELIYLLVDSIVSEKRFEYKNSSLIELNIDANAYGVFCNVVPQDFKRVLSNVINNSVEALVSTNKQGAKIEVELSKAANAMLRILIKDNGEGISQELISRIKSGAHSSSKSQGSGIGLISAIKTIESFYGTLEIRSEAMSGTAIIIDLPIVGKPAWFADMIYLNMGSKLIILDDYHGIHDVWKTRFSDTLKDNQIKIVDFYKPQDLIDNLAMFAKNDFYLIDYDLGDTLTGLDLIEAMELQDQAILVTSKYDDLEVKNRCVSLGVKILPKNYAPHILIHITSINADLILIDDDKALTQMWEFQAAIHEKKLIVFN